MLTQGLRIGSSAQEPILLMDANERGGA